MLLRDNVYENLRSDILTCRLAPGDDVREQDLAERYAVSRQPVREALLRLEREHLVTVQPRQGYRVNPISLSDARDLLRFRQTLEPACVAEAIENAPDQVLKALDEFRLFAGDHESFITYNRAFHSALAHASGNRRMAAALCDLIGQADRLVRVSVANVRGHDPAQLVAEHVALIDAMQRRDSRGRSAHHQGPCRANPQTRVAGAEAQRRDRRRKTAMNIPTKPAATEVEIHGNFVDGREIEAGNGAMLDVRNPATGDVIARIPNSTAEDIDRAMKSARAAFEGKEWGGMDIRARARLVNRLADAFEANLDKLYRLETLNNGRPVNETRAQLSRLPDFFRYFAGLALSRRDAVIPVEGSYLNYTLRTPIGIVANCTPFNHPLMILCKSLAAVLASGCVTVVKPSEYTPLTTLKLAQIFTEAGLPPGVFNIVLGLGPTAGKMLAEHPDIDKLVLTGGTEAGRIAGAAAAKVFAHQTMELGGKTPVLVFDDYDIERAVNYAAFGAFIGAGQTCICASRHIVQASIYDEFVERLKAKAKTIRIGDPFDPTTQLGPVISAKQRDRVLTYSKFGHEDGARLVTGGVAAKVRGP